MTRSYASACGLTSIATVATPAPLHASEHVLELGGLRRGEVRQLVDPANPAPVVPMTAARRGAGDRLEEE
jgi:hypothetical protein